MSRISYRVFDSKARAAAQRAGEFLGWKGGSTDDSTDGSTGVKGSGPEGVEASVKESAEASGSEGGLKGGNSSGFEPVAQGGNSSGDASVVQAGSATVVHPGPNSTVQGGEVSGEVSGVELHAVDGRLIACRPGEPPPLSVRAHTKAFLEWLRAHDKVPGNEVPVAILEKVLYQDFLGETGLPMKPWRPVSDILAGMPGVKKYQADWRDTDGCGGTPVVVKITRRWRRRGKVVHLAAERKRA